MFSDNLECIQAYNVSETVQIFKYWRCNRPLIEQVVKVIWQKGGIATAQGRFSRIRQMAPMRTSV